MKWGTLKIGQDTWTIVLANADRGFADDKLEGVAAWDTQTIYVARKLGVRQRSMVLLHEMMHIILPDAPEGTILRLERVLFPILWRGGWRPFERKNPKPRRDE